MKYNDPDLIDILAAEYVLGTLTGAARRRFARLISERQWIRKTVWEWETQISRMAENVGEITPSKRVWKNIQAHINVSKSSRTQTGLQFDIWKTWSLATTLLVAILIGYIGLLQKPSQQDNLMALVNDQQAQPLWVISANLGNGEIKFRAINATARAVDKAFELWMLPADNNMPPQSLGLLPVSKQEIKTTIPPGLRAILVGSKGLAVGLEPVGGSPTGLPTGPVLYQAELYEL